MWPTSKRSGWAARHPMTTTGCTTLAQAWIIWTSTKTTLSFESDEPFHERFLSARVNARAQFEAAPQAAQARADHRRQLGQQPAGAVAQPTVCFPGHPAGIGQSVGR